MDSPQRDRGVGSVAAAVAVVVVTVVVGFVAYRWGRGPVEELEEQLDRASLEAAALADKQADDQETNETQLDALRVLLIEGLAETEGRSREIAERVAAGSYLLGAVETCRAILGESEPRCDNLVEALTEPSYPGDPGYIPKPADRDIMSIAGEFERLVNGICTRDAWPYRLPEADFRIVRQACDSYDSMVGRELAD